jgi:hypothetical protein
MIEQRLRMDEVDYPPLWLKTHGTLNFERRNVKAMGMAGVLQLHTWYRYDKNLLHRVPITRPNLNKRTCIFQTCAGTLLVQRTRWMMMMMMALL